MKLPRWVAVAGLLVVCCRRADAPEAGHDHGAGHAAGEQAEAQGPPTISFTKWTDSYELFVELTVPVAGKRVAYHAHVTRLSDYAPVPGGTFRVRFKTPIGVAHESVQKGTKRPGIFAHDSPAPRAGKYTLEMAYEQDGHTAVFECGEITVPAKAEDRAGEPPAALLLFSKESQWKIPFATAWAERRAVAREMELPAVVEPAAGVQLTIAAATGGRFHHNPKLALTPGLRLRKGDVVGSIAPAVSGEDFGQLESTVQEARLAREQTERELARIEPLVRENLLPERRRLDLQNELESQSARLRAAQRRLGRVVTPGGPGGLAVTATLEGVVSDVLVPNGEPVEAGTPLVRLGGTDHLWVRARFVARPVAELGGATPVAVRLPNSERVDLEKLGARFLSPLPVVDAASRVATWIVDVSPAVDVSALPSDLRPGVAVVLAVRFGAPEDALVVPRSAVVEINTRPYVFVQVGGEQFERRAVTTGAADGPWRRIANGVAAGERVVTTGGFDIHLASQMGAVESHRH